MVEGTGTSASRFVCPIKRHEKEQMMAEKDPKVVKQESSQTLTDEQIVTERKMPRRSFLTAAGALLVGAAALASGVRAVAQQGSDPDSKKAADPDTKDKKKASDPDKKKKKTKTSATKGKKAADPDKKKKAPPKTDPDGARY
ncbi:MAG: hypothetical protein ACYDCM_05095 [Candidatus Acidiferrales bacterium]